MWFLVITLFWVVMNVLLWRSEMGGSEDAGSPLPAAAVWERMLTAPDESSLEIYRQGRKIGYCRWAPKVEEVLTAPPADAEAEPEGRVKGITGYTLFLDGNVLPGEDAQRLRFSWQAELGPNQEWRTMKLRLIQRPNLWEIRADAATQTLTLRLGEEPGGWERRFTFAELLEPASVLAALGLPLPPGVVSALLPGATAMNPKEISLGLTWEARREWVRIRSARAPAYRLRARLLDKYEATAWISRVGEILRLELPGEVALVNEALPVLRDKVR